MEKDANIKNRLRDLRQKQHLSQEELGEKLGISRQSIIALEQGKYMPSLPLAVSMCNFFQSAFEEMFDFEREIDEMFSSGPKIVIHDLNQTNKLDQNNIICPDDSIGTRKERNMPGFMKPWEPFREVSLRDAMDRLLEDSVVTSSRAIGMPKIDMKETKDSIQVKAELPGVAEEDVTIEVSDGVLTISGEKKGEKEEEKEGYYYKESFSGSFSRSVSLPSEVKAEKTEAEMDNGVLNITIPKAEAKKPHKITVKKKTKIEKK